MIVCMSCILKDIFTNLYGFREGPEDDLDIPREKVPWLSAVYSAADLASLTQKKLPEEWLLEYPLERVADYWVYLNGLMSCELNKEQKPRWLRALFNLLECPVKVLRHWMSQLKFSLDLNNNKDHRRLVRNTEEADLVFLRVLTSIFNTVRALDLADVASFLQRTMLDTF